MARIFKHPFNGPKLLFALADGKSPTHHGYLPGQIAASGLLIESLFLSMVLEDTCDPNSTRYLLRKHSFTMKLDRPYRSGHWTINGKNESCFEMPDFSTMLEKSPETWLQSIAMANTHWEYGYCHQYPCLHAVAKPSRLSKLIRLH